MKKIFQLIVLVAFLPSLAQAQITIEADQIKPLGVFAIQSKDSTLDASITPGGTGMQTWDFSALKDQSRDTLQFYTPAETDYAALFPDANLAATLDSIAVIYLEKNDDHLVTYGSFGTTTYGPYTVSTSITYDPPQTIIKFPLVLNQAFTETIRGTIQIPGSTINLPYDSIRAVTINNRSVVVDAFGTMTTPLGVFETLRSREVETSIDSAYILSSGVWFPLQGSAPKTITFHNWWTNQNGLGFPIVQIKDSPDTGTSALWLNDFVSSTSDSKSYLQVNVSPNPASNQLNVELPATFTGQLHVLDLHGRLVMRQSAGLGTNTLNILALNTGSYVLVLVDKQGKVRGFERFEVIR